MTSDSGVLIPGLGAIPIDSGLIRLDACSDGCFVAGREGVVSVMATGDRKVEFIAFHDHTMAYVRSALGYPAYYPVHPVALERPVQAVLMDLDGTSVHSEGFWIWIIERTTASLLGNPRFELEPADLPFVSGHSVSEHLEHCIRKYCPDKTVEQARECYFEHTRREMQAVLDGRGRSDAFIPAPGLKEFLLAIKAQGIRIALVTSGLHEKAWPEIVAAFWTLKMGDPREFYDAIITAGYPLRRGEAGTLGELSPKPHPWLYAEAARVGLGIPFEQRNSVLGVEDSGAGVCAIRLAGFPTVGMAGGNIIKSGTRALCDYYCATFEQVLVVVEGEGSQ
jgi:beta-phosphoglucomutase-like phosphatase (HAD superfamily)